MAEQGFVDSVSLRNGIAVVFSENSVANSQASTKQQSEFAPKSNSAQHNKVVPIIDVSNVARVNSQTAELFRLEKMLQKFAEVSLKPICIADASLRHVIDQTDSYESMIGAKTILQAPAGSPADSFIMGIASQLSCKGVIPYVVTNDRKLAESARPARNVKFLFVPWENEELLVLVPEVQGLAGGVG